MAMSLSKRNSVGLPCHECGETDFKVIDTRGRLTTPGIHRRLRYRCGHRETTLERPIRDWLALAERLRVAEETLDRHRL